MGSYHTGIRSASIGDGIRISFFAVQNDVVDGTQRYEQQNLAGAFCFRLGQVNKRNLGWFCTDRDNADRVLMAERRGVAGFESCAVSEPVNWLCTTPVPADIR
jgi:hypothetical protein